MVDVLGFTFTLPEPINNQYGEFLVVLFIWAALAFIVIQVAHLIMKALSNREGDAWGVIAGAVKIVKVPLVVVVVLYGLVNSLSILDLPDQFTSVIQTVYDLTMIFALAWLF